VRISSADVLMTARVALDQTSRELSTEDFVNLSWSAGHTRTVGRALWKDTRVRAMKLLQSELLETRNLANLVWSYATCRIQDAPSLAVIGTLATAQLPEFQLQDVSSTAWALAALRYFHTSVFDAIACAVSSRCTEFTLPCLASTAWCLAKLACRNETVIEVLTRAAR